MADFPPRNFGKRAKRLDVVRQDPVDLPALGDLAGDCPTCAEIERRKDSVVRTVQTVNLLLETFADLERIMYGLQVELRKTRFAAEDACRDLRARVLAHPSCASCGVLVGENHATKDLVREPIGDELVCRVCHRNLEQNVTTAARSRRQDRR